MSSSKIFVPVSSDSKSNTSATEVCVFDVSGSTKGKYLGGTVQDAMINSLFARYKAKGVTAFYCVFFGSPRSGDFALGYVIEECKFLVSEIEVFRKRARELAHENNLTMPHLAIGALPEKWMRSKNVNATVCGDGELYDGNRSSNSSVKAGFSTAVTKFFATYPFARMSILALDASATADSGEANVGSDMFSALQTAGLTGSVTDYTVVTKGAPEGRNLFHNEKVPAGFIPYKDLMFAQSDEPTFFTFVQEQLLGEDFVGEKVFTLVRHVSMAVAAYVKASGCTPEWARANIKSYANAFRLWQSCDEKETTVDDLVDLFTRQVNNTIKGHAETSKAFVLDKKARFAAASASLAENTKEAVGTNSSTCLTWPVGPDVAHLVVYEVPQIEVTGALELGGTKYPQCTFSDSAGTATPVIPCNRRTNGSTDQAYRQYARAVNAQQIRGKAMEERAKFFSLVQMLQVFLSPDIPNSVKDAYINLGVTLLKKTLAGKDVTELDHFSAGNVHPNSGRTPWSTDLQSVIAVATGGADVNVFAVWYSICKVICTRLGSDTLATNQLVHCKSGVPNPSSWRDTLINLPRIGYQFVEGTDQWERTDPVSLDSTSSGGFAYPEHPCGSYALPGSKPCAPKFVLSKATVDDMTSESGCVTCLYCRSKVSRDSLITVGESKASDFRLPIEGNFSRTYTPSNTGSRSKYQASNIGSLPIPSGSLPLPNDEVKEATMSLDGLRIGSSGGNVAINMRGVIGCGKSTAVKLLAEELSKLGSVLVVSPDSHCVNLIASGVYTARNCMATALNACKQEVQAFLFKPGRKFTITDTCGDIGTPGTIFGIYPGSGWTYATFSPNLYDEGKMSETEWRQYALWSLSNCLDRTAAGQSPGGYWLNPESAGVQTCVGVHQKKFNALFKGKCKLPGIPTKNVGATRGALKADTAAYATRLSGYDLANTVKAFVALVVGTPVPQ